MKGTEVNHAKTNENPACHICNEKGHTVTTPKGNTIIPYYVCNEFVKMSPAERLSKLKSKNLCLKCLYPGLSKGQNINVSLHITVVPIPRMRGEKNCIFYFVICET